MAVLIALASLIWVPIGVWVGLRPRVASIVQPIAQFLAAFPANLFFPLRRVGHRDPDQLSPDIWLSPLMILGTQWYILFNVIVGASAIAPGAALRGAEPRRARLAVVAPGGAAGGISVLRDRRHHGLRRLLEREHRRRGRHLGHADADARTDSAPTSAMRPAPGTSSAMVLGIVVLSLFVVVLNRVFWRPLYARAERKFRIS